MLWAIDHAEAADEIIDCITESLSILQTPTHKKVTIASHIQKIKDTKILNYNFCCLFLDLAIVFNIRYSSQLQC